MCPKNMSDANPSIYVNNVQNCSYNTIFKTNQTSQNHKKSKTCNISSKLFKFLRVNLYLNVDRLDFETV